MTEVAAVILGHTDPSQARRLIDALPDVPVFLHWDAKSRGEDGPPDGLPARVHAVQARDTRLSSWSLVRAELTALDDALRRTRAGHIAVLSGADYPLVPVPELVDALTAWGDRSFLYNRAMPYPPWSTPRHDDGGLWRLRRRFVVRNDNVVAPGGQPLRWPGRRELPVGLVPRAASQWKIYSNRDGLRLLRALDHDPALVRFWRTSFIPDESCAASILASPDLVGNEPLPLCAANAWHYDFPPGGDHPRTLSRDDLPALRELRHAPLIAPALPIHEKPPFPYRRFFVRKVTSSAGRLCDDLDTLRDEMPPSTTGSTGHLP